MNDQQLETIEFTGCKHLDFEPNYDAIRQVTPMGLFWMRKQEPSMVQFCKRRGRLYGPLACLGSENARCGDYEESEHFIELPLAELESLI